jgi:hypothetical protein
MIRMMIRGDSRGRLIAAEGGRDVPFAIKRVHYVFGKTCAVDGGPYAHLQTHQFVIAVAGWCTLLLDDGRRTVSASLGDPAEGLTLPPMVWHTITSISPDCVLMVIASSMYDEHDYIREHDKFLGLVCK